MHKSMTATIKVGLRGKIALPRKLLRAEKIRLNDKFQLIHLTPGEIVLRKRKPMKKVDFFKLVKTLPKINMQKALADLEKSRAMDE